MVYLTDHPLKPTPIEANTPVADPSAISDRRRPGRFEWINPALLQLLRGPAQAVDALPPEASLAVYTPLGESTKSNDIAPYEDTDDLAAGRGIVVGLLLSFPIWAIIGFGVWLIF